MADLTQIPNFHLKLVFLIHFLFTSIVCMGYWVTSAYLFYNTLLIVVLLWAIHHTSSEEPVQIATLIDATSIILDILFLLLCFPTNNQPSNSFTAAIAILHLIARPFLVLVLHQKGRAGQVISSVFGGPRNETYEDMDRGVPTQQTPAQGGYDFSTAQQI